MFYTREMRKIVLLMHVSLDGFVAGPSGAMDWIRIDDELWDYVTTITDAADTALYGAKTYQMMESYWPTAAQQPDATKHDIDHARWANSSQKLVFSKTLRTTNWDQTSIVGENWVDEITRLKKQPGKNMLMLGSPSLARSFMDLGLIDEYRLNVNPVALGVGLALFEGLGQPMNLELVRMKRFESGVLGLHYEKVARGNH